MIQIGLVWEKQKRFITMVEAGKDKIKKSLLEASRYAGDLVQYTQVNGNSIRKSLLKEMEEGCIYNKGYGVE